MPPPWIASATLSGWGGRSWETSPLAGTPPLPHAALAVLAVGDGDAAAHEFARASAGALSSSVSYNHAFCLMKLGRLNEAVVLLVVLTAHDARDAWGRLAEAYQRLGHDADARAARERASFLYEDSPPRTSWKARPEAMDRRVEMKPEIDDEDEGPDRLH